MSVEEEKACPTDMTFDEHTISTELEATWQCCCVDGCTSTVVLAPSSVVPSRCGVAVHPLIAQLCTNDHLCVMHTNTLVEVTCDLFGIRRYVELR